MFPPLTRPNVELRGVWGEQAVNFFLYQNNEEQIHERLNTSKGVIRSRKLSLVTPKKMPVKPSSILMIMRHLEKGK